MGAKYKTVMLDGRGYTLDGRYKLVLVEPTDNACYAGLKARTEEMAESGTINPSRATYRAMVAESPAPELGEAVLSHYVNNDNGEVIPAEDFYDLPVSVWTPLFKF